ncbi:hypothetical protein AB3331_06540 [Streptococcus sp. H49]|uniref:hypothetical protein n=1 Tax=Streptococcus huangxiaojuni TaxID=3237239 RepID=UPI0034A543F2
MASDAGITLTAIFFTRILGRVQFTRYKGRLKRKRKIGGKPEIFDFAGAPLPERLEGCGCLTVESVLYLTMLFPQRLGRV